jgi:deazaflavin-dependent oxidoreductase (nitroreductase family)
MPNVFEKAFTEIHKGIYNLSGGRLMSSFDQMPILLLTTTGRKSGKARTSPLLYIDQDGSYVVVGSAAGRDRHPAWYLNLAAAPEAQVRVGKRTTSVRARTAAGEERERLFTAFAETAKRYADYQAKTERRIPVVVLEPRD